MAMSGYKLPFKLKESDTMIEIQTSPRSFIRCYPENEQKHLESTENAVKGRYHNKGSPRKYPLLRDWVSTADYIRTYEEINHLCVRLVPVKYECPNIKKPAPFLNPAFPEVIEEPNEE